MLSCADPKNQPVAIVCSVMGTQYTDRESRRRSLGPCLPIYFSSLLWWWCLKIGAFLLNTQPTHMEKADPVPKRLQSKWKALWPTPKALSDVLACMERKDGSVFKALCSIPCSATDSRCDTRQVT